MPIERINPTDMRVRAGLTHVVKAGDTAYLASQASLDADSRIINVGDPEAQTRKTYQELEAGVRAIGGTMNDVVSVTCLIERPEFYEQVVEIGGNILGSRPSSSTTIVLPMQAFTGQLLAAYATVVTGITAKSREVFDPAGLALPRGRSHVVRAGNVVYVSGQIGVDKNKRVIGKDDASLQARQAYENLETCLNTAGASRTDVVKTTIFYRHPYQYEAICDVTRDFYGDHMPAGTISLAGLTALHAVVQIEAIAVVNDEKRYFNPKSLHRPTGFTSIVQAGGTSYISGQFAFDRNGEFVGRGDFELQLSQVYRNLQTALEEIGVERANVVRSPMYYIRPEFYGVMRERRQEFWGSDLPTPPSMPVLGLPDPYWLTGIEAIAVSD